MAVVRMLLVRSRHAEQGFLFFLLMAGYSTDLVSVWPAGLTVCEGGGCCVVKRNSQQLKSYLRLSLCPAVSPHMDPQDKLISVVSPIRKSILVCAFWGCVCVSW